MTKTHTHSECGSFFSNSICKVISFYFYTPHTHTQTVIGNIFFHEWAAEHNWPVMRKKRSSNQRTIQVIDRKEKDETKKKSIQVFYRQFPMAIETISADFLQSSLPVFYFLYFFFYIYSIALWGRKISWNLITIEMVDCCSVPEKYDYINIEWMQQHSISIVIKNDMQPLYYRKDTAKQC